MTLTFDQNTINSTGIFVSSELDKLDPVIHHPIDGFTWGRDITLIEDLSITDETTSFLLSNYTVVGGANPNGKNYISHNSDDIARVQVGTQKITSPVNLWGLGLEYTIFALEKSIKVNRPLDKSLHESLKKKWHQDIDEQVYIGDEPTNTKGLLNQDIIPAMNSTLDWRTAEPKEILGEFDYFLYHMWAQTVFNKLPEDILLPPSIMSILVTRKVSESGDKSILNYLLENNIAKIQNIDLKIRACKWCMDTGANGSPRIMAYCNRNDICRIGIVPINRLAPQFRGFNQEIMYYGAIGTVEIVIPEACGYLDGATSSFDSQISKLGYMQ